MQKALEIGKKSATGVFQLFIGVAGSTLIMAIGTLILVRLITPEEYGLYSIALIPAYTAILFRDWGVNSAITKYTASLRVENKEENIYEIIVTGILFEVTAGLILSIILILLSNSIASTIFSRPEAAPLIAIASTTIFAEALLRATQSSFTGFERMELKSLTNICQAIVKSTASPFLVLIGYGALGVILGHTVSFLISAIVGLVILYLTIIRKIKKKNPQKISITKTLKKMLHYGVPLSLSWIITGLLAQFYAFMMAIYCTDTVIGNYQAATQFATVLTFFTIPVSTVLFPAFSKINPKSELELLQTVFTSSVKYMSLMLVPTTVAMMVLSKPMVSTLFGEKWRDAPFLLTLYVINYLFMIFGSLSLGSLLMGLGETKTQLKLSLINFLFGVPLALLLIPNMGIVGLILTGIVAGIPSICLGLYWVWKHYKVKANVNSSFRILAASTLAATATFLVISLITYTDWIQLIIGGLTFLATYVVTAPIMGAINQADIYNLRMIFSGLGIISKLINVPLALMEKLSNEIYHNP